MRDLDATESNNNLQEESMTTINPSRVLIDQYLAMIGCNGIEAGDDALTAKVQADFDAWNEENGIRPDDMLGSSASRVGLTINEYASVLDTLTSMGDAEDVVSADTMVTSWTVAAELAYGLSSGDVKSVLISAHATTTRVI
ncbi:hypothetical protein [Rhodococcus aetherivorans]|uniref:hypothetical protein n=1 Tax=Rhodococcus aetherivorans TaxID=191292 RepID=UPI0002D23D2C|nr:hypothetical protein [Rhodococcus aetherivorans]CCW12896.1 hypothetical protein EBESD8_34480 [Rhodococcus aetherivorans]